MSRARSHAARRHADLAATAVGRAIAHGAHPQMPGSRLGLVDTVQAADCSGTITAGTVLGTNRDGSYRHAVADDLTTGGIGLVLSELHEAYRVLWSGSAPLPSFLAPHTDYTLVGGGSTLGALTADNIEMDAYQVVLHTTADAVILGRRALRVRGSDLGDGVGGFTTLTATWGDAVTGDVPFQVTTDGAGSATYVLRSGRAVFNASRLQGQPVATTAPATSYSLVWDGSAWAPTQYTRANYLRSAPVSATAPTAGTVLAWNGSAWVPASEIALGDNTAGGGTLRVYFAAGQYIDIDSSGSITAVYGDSNTVRIRASDFGSVTGKTVQLRELDYCDAGVAKKMLVLCSEAYTP